MELLRSRPITGHIEDGERATYECQACLRQSTYDLDAYDISTTIPCPTCGWDEPEEENEP
ncbi:hypothetical protein AVW13_11790 [Brevibacterium casei]|uniref:Small CPxCG-related zinc finger protein n=1 Tax=Brevibacterium casei TaxID=33889 RepID=A0AB34XW44_9MICO|nr:hypothetical protein AVW13_11790 [Brevibacterium casei]